MTDIPRRSDESDFEWGHRVGFLTQCHDLTVHNVFSQYSKEFCRGYMGWKSQAQETNEAEKQDQKRDVDAFLKSQLNDNLSSLFL